MLNQEWWEAVSLESGEGILFQFNRVERRTANISCDKLIDLMGKGEIIIVGKFSL